MARGTWQEFKDQRDAPERNHDAWVVGRFILYAPTFYPALEVKEWGGRWDGGHKAWRLPRIKRMVEKIQGYDPKARMTRDVLRLLENWDISLEQAHQFLDEHGHDHPTFADLYDFQVQGAHALVRRNYHGKLLILSPGLGKTPTSIVAADLKARFKNNPSPRFLVVCPKALLFNWQREIAIWSEYAGELKAGGYGGVKLIRTNNRDQAGVETWSVTNPEVLFERARLVEDGPLRITGKLDEAFELPWDVVILDESVLYKNRKAKRAGVVKSLAHKAEQIWLLSGAPITHDNSDIWQQFNIVEPDYFSSFWRFAEEFCVIERTPWSNGEIVGSRHGMVLRDEYPDLMLVRNQEEVFDNLPSVIFQDVELPLTRRQKKAHDDLMDLWMHELEYNADSRIDITAVIAMLTRLQQVTSNLKNLETTGQHWPDESSKADAVESIIDTDAQYPMLIWTWHRPGADALLKRIQKKFKKGDNKDRRVEMVVGGNKNADKIIEEFKDGQIDVLIMSIGVGKYGHTLANVQDVVYYDRTWDSDAMFQSLHRYAGARGRLAGYEHNPRVRILRCRGTVDDFVEMNLAGKLPDMAKVTGADLLKILRSIGANYVEDLEGDGVDV